MVRRDFTFRGKTPEELEKMGLGEFARLCTSRTARTIKRVGNTVGWKKFAQKILKAKETLKAGKYPKPVRTHNRDFIVTPQMVGITIAVYHGKEFINVEVTEKMLGQYLGEFVLTRKKLVHGKAGIGATKSSTAITARG